MTDKPLLHATRRHFLTAGGGAVLISTLPLSAFAAEADLLKARTDLFGDRPIQEGRVKIGRAHV